MSIKAFLHKITQISTGTLVGNGIAFLSAPLIAILYNPKQVGSFGLFCSAVAVISLVCSLRYEFAIPIASDPREATSLFCLTWVLSVPFCCTAFFLLLVWPDNFLGGRGTLIGSVEPLYVALGAFTTAMTQTVGLWLIREQRFKFVSLTKLIQSTSTCLLQLGLGFLNLVSTGLILGYVTGQALGNATVLREVAIHLNRAKIKSEDVWHAMRRYKNFAIYSAPAAFLNGLTINLPVFYLGHRFGTEPVGYLTLCYRTLLAPIGLLTISTAQVLCGELASTKRKSSRELGNVFRTRFAQLGMISLTVVGGSAVLVYFFFERFFGRAWVSAELCFYLLLPSVLANLVASPFHSILEATERQDLHLLREAITFLITGASLLVAAYLTTTWSGSLLVISLAQTLAKIWYISVSFFALKSDQAKGQTAELISTAGSEES